MDYKQFESKFLLLDTNVLIYAAKYQPQMAGILKKWRDAKVNLVLDDLVKFEFLRKADKLSEELALKDFLLKLFEIDLKDIDKTIFPLTNDAIIAATTIANLYASRLKNARIELTDCFLAGQMKKYNSHKEHLFLATANHDDFPKLLFDRVGIETVDLGEDIVNIGYYIFKKDRFDSETSRYLAQG